MSRNAVWEIVLSIVICNCLIQHFHGRIFLWLLLKSRFHIHSTRVTPGALQSPATSHLRSISAQRINPQLRGVYRFKYAIITPTINNRVYLWVAFMFVFKNFASAVAYAISNGVGDVQTHPFIAYTCGTVASASAWMITQEWWGWADVSINAYTCVP